MALDPLAPLKLGVRVGVGVLRFELRVLEQLLGLGREQPEAPARQPAPFGAQATPPRPEPAPQRPEPVPDEPPAAPPVAVATEPEPEPEPEPPAHIDTEPELVGEFAEPGAEDGAGAEIHVAEPWDGYRKMTVADLRDRVMTANAEELAVIQLYETTHRRRRTVLGAVERRSKQLANAPAQRS